MPKAAGQKLRQSIVISLPGFANNAGAEIAVIFTSFGGVYKTLCCSLYMHMCRLSLKL